MATAGRLKPDSLTLRWQDMRSQSRSNGVVILRLEARKAGSPEPASPAARTGRRHRALPALLQRLAWAGTQRLHRKALGVLGGPEPGAMPRVPHCMRRHFSRLIVSLPRRGGDQGSRRRRLPRSGADQFRLPPKAAGAIGGSSTPVARAGKAASPARTDLLAAGAAIDPSAPAGPLPLSGSGPSTAF